MGVALNANPITLLLQNVPRLPLHEYFAKLREVGKLNHAKASLELF